MRVLLIVEHFPPYIGGAEKLFGIIARSYAALGWKVDVVTTRFDNSLPKFERDGNLSIHRINCKNRYRFSIQAIPKAMKLAANCDVIQSSTYNALIVAKICSLLRKKPILITVHEIWGRMWFKMPYISKLKKWLYFTFERTVLSFGYDRYIAISTSTYNQLLDFGISKSKVRLIYNGYEPIYQDRHLESSNVRPIFFGRLGVSKGIDILIRAVSLMKSDGIDFQMNIVLPLQPKGILTKIKEEIKKFQVEECFEFHHELSDNDLRELLLISSYGIVPSRAEGFGYVAVELSHLGIPFIHSNRGGLSETASGKTITMTSYSEESLYAAILRAEKGEWDETPLKKFDVAKMVESYQSILAELCTE